MGRVSLHNKIYKYGVNAPVMCGFRTGISYLYLVSAGPHVDTKCRLRPPLTASHGPFSGICLQMYRESLRSSQTQWMLAVYGELSVI